MGAVRDSCARTSAKEGLDVTAAIRVDPVSERISRRIAKTVGPHKYSMWFDQTAKLDYDVHDHQLRVAVPNRFVADWIGAHFKQVLQTAAHREIGREVDLSLTIEPARFVESPTSTAKSAPKRTKSKRPDGTVALTGGSPRPTFRYRLDDFIVGSSNELAYVAATRLAEPNEPVGNPLFVHGGCGLGKTHLLQGICDRVRREQPDARVTYVTGEQFTNAFIEAMRSNRLKRFRRDIRELDLLAVDDVDFLANKQATQQEFLYTFDAIGLCGARVVLASDCHPKLTESFSESLVSRCVSGMVVQIHTPDDDTRVRITKALAKRRRIRVVDAVVEQIAQRCQGSIREIEGTLTKLQAMADLDQRQRKTPETQPPMIGRALASRVFAAEWGDAPRKPARFDTILETVCDKLGVPKTNVIGAARQRHVVLARSLVIHLARLLTTMSYPEIASALQKSNHSSIITAAQRVTKQLANDELVTIPATMQQVPVTQLVQQLTHAVGKA